MAHSADQCRVIREGGAIGPCPSPPGRGTVVVACGSISRELGRVRRQKNLACDLRFLDAILCLRPWELRDALEAELQALSRRYSRIYVAYGACAPDIDWLAETYGGRRTPVAHCYELLAGPRFRGLLREEIGTFFLSSGLCRDFNRRIVEGMGLGHVEQATAIIFARYRRAVYLRTEHDPVLEDKARQAAEYLGLPLQTEDVGLGHVEELLLPFFKIDASLT